MPPDLVSLGEIMLRLSPPKFERLRRTRTFNIYPCGAQFNVAANFAALGKHSLFLTRLPDNELGYLARELASGCSVDISQVQLVAHEKIGMVFVEFSVAPRRAVHLYDRRGSAASLTTPLDFNWAQAVAGAHYAYTDGIFPALNPGCQEATLAFLEAAKQSGCRTCFDVNYRQTLWEPGEAAHFYRAALPRVDILVTNRDISEKLLGYQGHDEELLRTYQREFGCQVILLTYREMQGLSHGTWRSLAILQDKFHAGRQFSFDVIDQYGTGDAFFAGFLSAFQDSADIQYSLDFGNALCALAHTVEGDQTVFTPAEVQAVLHEDYILKTRR
jgi:2-dehydro-3-deoxygluconokinase